QEVNAQAAAKRQRRTFVVLDKVLKTTPYAAYYRATTTGPSGGPADLHNLVTACSMRTRMRCWRSLAT
ncbi:MAG TPA: hypothetical protein VHM01_13060, partial [Alphaproteobacteria bacterium]|nr:hypothetical protein [Alphaproteobacteria bacterium]